MISHKTVGTTGSAGTTNVNIVDGAGGVNEAGVDASGGLKVHIIANDVSSSGGTSSADNAAYTAGTTAGTPMMGACDDTGTTAANENAVAIARITAQRALHTNLRNTAGTEVGTAGAPLRTDPTGSTTQPISAASLPLPTGAAQEHTTAASPHAVRLSDGAAFYKGTTPSDTQPISAASLPLPTGAATESTLSALNGKVATAITADYDTGGGTQTTQMLGIALPASGGAVAGGTLTAPIRTDPTGTTTQPVSGTVTANIGTSGSLALDATLTGGTQKTKLVDTGGTNVATVSAAGALKVDGSAVTQPVSGTVTANQGGSNWSINNAQVAGTTVDVNSGVKSAGTQRIVIATDQPALTNALLVNPQAISTGGYDKFKDAALNATVVTIKASAGKLGGYYIYNPNSAVAYVQIFDVVGTVTLGTTSPDMILGIPATSAANLDSGAGINFANAIKIAATTTATGSTGNSTALVATAWYK